MSPLDRLDQLRLSGARALEDAELLALVVGERPARRLVSALGSLDRLAQAPLVELEQLGLGAGRACRLQAALELGRRAISPPLRRGTPIASAHDVDALLRGRLAALDHEELHVLGLDTGGRLALHALVGVGSVNLVHVHPGDVFRPLVREAVVSAIVAHNHPSGEFAPSGADTELTLRLAEAGLLVGVPLLDHVIVARDGHYSFAASGLLGAASSGRAASRRNRAKR